MADWPTTTIGDIFDIGAGKTMSSKVRANAEPTPFLRTSNVFWDRIDLSKVDEMPMLPWEREDKSLRSGDLLVCEGGEIGRAAVWEGRAEGISFQNHLHRLRRKSDDIDPGFYAYFLQSAFTQLGIYEGAGNKTTIPNLSRSNLAALDVPKPDYAEQCDIRAVLKWVRAAMDMADGGVRLADELKRATMRELFTRGMRREAQKDSEIGPLPESWEVARIGDVATRTQYGMSVRGQPSGRYPILRMNCQEDGKVVLRNLQYVDLDAAKYNSFRIERGDILFNRTNSIELVGRTAIFEHDDDAVFASYLVRLTVDQDRCLPRYLNHFMNWPATQAEIKKLASRAVGQANINASKLRTVAFPLPPTIAEQQEIVAILDAIDGKIDLHRRKKAVLEELFRSLLHKLMTGEIRVSDLDLTALEANQKVAA